jgi:phospholipid/cholesterol/gamma-HCH transport system permease protein
MRTGSATVEREGRSAVVRLQGDLVIASSHEVYGTLRTVARRRDVKRVVLDFSRAGRVDSSGIAIVSLFGKQLRRHGKELELSELQDHHRAAFELRPEATGEPPPSVEQPGPLERIGDRVFDVGGSARSMAALIADTLRQGFAVVTRKKRLPAGALGDQISAMGVDAVFIVGLLSFLLGVTMAFQGATQLSRFGAGVFVADMISVSMVRELAPLMTAIILTGRTGAAIAAELGTMKVRSEVDALTSMGINPVRFLIVPRMAAITLVVPALTLMAMFIGMLGGMLVAWFALDMPAVTFWLRAVERLDGWDFAHGIGKSVVFAWIIGLAGSHLGMRAGNDPSSVGAATTRTVVTSIFFIIIVDAVFATISTVTRYG